MPLISAALAALILPTARVHAADAEATEQQPLPVAIVDALNKLSSAPHAGYRANLAKGVLVTGSFNPAVGAKALSKAVQFSKTEAWRSAFNWRAVPAPTSSPHRPTAFRSQRQRRFAIFCKRPTPIEQFLVSHPTAPAFVTTPRLAPMGFGTLAFYGVNAFRFTNAQGPSASSATRSCRWRARRRWTVTR